MPAAGYRHVDDRRVGAVPARHRLAAPRSRLAAGQRGRDPQWFPRRRISCTIQRILLFLLARGGAASGSPNTTAKTVPSGDSMWGTPSGGCADAVHEGASLVAVLGAAHVRPVVVTVEPAGGVASRFERTPAAAIAPITTRLTTARPVTATRCARMRRPRRHAAATFASIDGTIAAAWSRLLTSLDIGHRLLFDFRVGDQPCRPEGADRFVGEGLHRSLRTAHDLGRLARPRDRRSTGGRARCVDAAVALPLPSAPRSRSRCRDRRPISRRKAGSRGGGRRRGGGSAIARGSARRDAPMLPARRGWRPCASRGTPGPASPARAPGPGRRRR